MPSEDYEQAAIRTVASGASVVPYAVEMEERFDHTDHFIVEFDPSRDGQSSWQSISYFGERYRLTMEVPVQIDASRKQIISCGIPNFVLNEVVEIKMPNVEARYARQWTFGVDEWTRFKAIDDDWASIGIELRFEPVEHFDEYVAAWSRDIPDVKLSAGDEN
jgi:hypothetical protein